jgi:hypothetical protein
VPKLQTLGSTTTVSSSPCRARGSPANLSNEILSGFDILGAVQLYAFRHPRHLGREFGRRDWLEQRIPDPNLSPVVIEAVIASANSTNRVARTIE